MLYYYLINPLYFGYNALKKRKLLLVTYNTVILSKIRNKNR